MPEKQLYEICEKWSIKTPTDDIKWVKDFFKNELCITEDIKIRCILAPKGAICNIHDQEISDLIRIEVYKNDEIIAKYHIWQKDYILEKEDMDIEIY